MATFVAVAIVIVIAFEPRRKAVRRLREYDGGVHPHRSALLDACESTLGREFTRANLYHYFSIREVWVYDDAAKALEDIEGIPEIEAVQWYGESIPADAIAHLSSHQIRSFHATSVPVSDDDMASVARLVDLEELNVDFTNVTDEGLRELQRLDRLTQFSARGCNFVGTGFASWASRDSLRSLDLRETNLDWDGTNIIIESFPRLRRLHCWETPVWRQDASNGSMYDVIVPSLPDLVEIDDLGEDEIADIRAELGD